MLLFVYWFAMIWDDRRNKGREVEAQTAHSSKFFTCVPLNVLKLGFIKQCFRGWSHDLKMPPLNKQEVV